MKALEGELQKFVAGYISSFLAWDLLVFFKLNPGTVDTALGISKRLGRDPAEVEETLEQFFKKGIVRKKVFKNKSIYLYEPPQELKRSIEEFVSSVEDDYFRMNVLDFLLKTGFSSKNKLN